MQKYLNVVYFAHGKESGPWGTKIKRLARIAKVKGFQVESPDYSQTFNPDERVAMLLKLEPAALDHLVLVGSSMGGYVSTVASETLKPHGMFLMAPAFYLPDYANQNPIPAAHATTVVHGWRDEVVPVDNVIGFAKKHGVLLHVLNDGHRLVDSLSTVEHLFGLFLDEVLLNR